MVFSSLIFLYLFLPAVLLAHWAVPTPWRNNLLLAASLLFYACGEPLFVFWLVATSLVDHRICLALASLSPDRRRERSLLLVGSLSLNLGALVWFKYAGFLAAQVTALSRLLGGSGTDWAGVALPLGISFFTFHKVSCVVDVWRGQASPPRRAGEFLLYVCLFPQLVAGPIVRWREIADQFGVRNVDPDLFASGCWRFLLGLGRKVLVANPLGAAADLVFALPEDSLLPARAWVGLAAYTFQIYFDFAGYSDMAVGLGRMFGFRLPENFDRPYASVSPADFWRRWHMSLSNFMRDYLYLPLGGNRVHRARAVANLWTVFLASGLWHGAGWNFLLWGAWHGLLLSADRFLRLPFRLPRAVAVALTFLLVSLGWVLFRCDSTARAGVYFSALFSLEGWGAAWRDPSLTWPQVFGGRTCLALALATLGSFAPVRLWSAWEPGAVIPLRGSAFFLRFATGAVLLILATASLANQSHNPFIYFRF